MFGDTKVVATNVYLGEGYVVSGTAVYPDNPETRLEIVWRSDKRESPKEVRLRGDSSKWATVEGISLGTTLKQVEALNAYPFRLAGFDFDYGGTVTDCGKGRLTYLGCDGSSRRQLIVRFASKQQPQSPEYLRVVGDRLFSSGHPAMQSINPTVHQLIVSIDPE